MSQASISQEEWLKVQSPSSSSIDVEKPFNASQESTPRAETFSENTTPTAPDPADDLDKPIPGWPRFAKLMADIPDFAAFPSFRDLNVKNLMYYQVELTKLQEELHKAEWRDSRDGSSEIILNFGKRAEFLLNSKDAPSHSQWDLVQRIRVCLKEYNEALLQFSQVSALPSPDSHNVETLRCWLIKSDGGRYMINGPGTEHWGPVLNGSDDDLPKNLTLRAHFTKMVRNLLWPHPPKRKNPELVAMTQPVKADRFTSWITHDFVPFHHCLKMKIKEKLESWKADTSTQDEETNSVASSATIQEPTQRGVLSLLVRLVPKSWFRQDVAEIPTIDDIKKNTLATYSNKGIMRFSAAVATVLACLLPIVAITVLSNIHELRDMLLVMAAFSAVFASGLMFVTDASVKRVDIFTATAAFAAVMVVFVQNQVEVDLQGT